MSQLDERTAEQPATPSGAIPAAKAPVGSSRIAVIGVLIAALVIAAAVLLGHDALVAAGAVDGSAWVDTAVGELDGSQPETWVPIVGVVLVLVGLWLLTTALLPRPRTTLPVRAVTGVQLRPRDLRRLVQHTVRDVDGVTSASVRANRRRVDIRVQTTGDDDTVGGQVEQDVNERLRALESPPTVRVRASGGSR